MICERTCVESEQTRPVIAERSFLTLSEAPTPRTRKRMRRRGTSLLHRIEVSVMAVAAIAALGAVTTSTINWWNATSESSSPPASYATVTVAKGDTLWSIAQRSRSSSQIVSDNLAQIRAVNPSLQAGGQLIPGQTLLVPVNHAVTPDTLHLAQASVPRRAF